MSKKNRSPKFFVGQSTHEVSRRRFLKKISTVSLAAGAPLLVSSEALGLGARPAPSDRIVMGCIGVGGRGTSNMRTFMNNPDVQVIAVADVEEKSSRYYRGRTAGREPARELVNKHYSKASKKSKACQSFKDFRDLLKIRDIDAVSIATPDHWHGLASIAAANAKKDIYCEKPLTNSIGEGRAVVEAVKKNGRILQTGSHERSNRNSRYAAELVLNGRIGKLKSIRIQMPLGEPHHKHVMSVKGLPKAEPTPDTLDYDFWLGHTPKKDYRSGCAHFWWRFVLAHGGGEMTDRGAHVIDLAQMGLGTDLTGPVKIQAKGNQGQGLYDTFMDYEFVNTFKNGISMIGTSEGQRGLKYEGTEGWVFVHVHGCRLSASSPDLLKEKIGESEIHLGRSPGHHRNFLDSVKSRKNPVAHAEIGHRSGTICHLNNIAMKLGRPLEWDPEKELFVNDEAANKLITPEMREPWKLS